jgi:hypothetical protein
MSASQEAEVGKEFEFMSLGPAWATQCDHLKRSHWDQILYELQQEWTCSGIQGHSMRTTPAVSCAHLDTALYHP